MRYSQVVRPSGSEVVEAGDPEPGPGEVLVRVIACGVCASERRAWGEHGDAAPARLGHEISGTVVRVGKCVYGWRQGDLVTGFGLPGFAELAVMKAAGLLPVPPGVAAEHALGEPLACLAEAFSRSPIGARDRVAIVGLGFMGLGFLQLVKQVGPAAMVGFDPLSGARETALTLGATETYDSIVDKAAFDVVIEAAGTASALRLAGNLVAQHGTLVVVGYHIGPREWDPQLWYKGATVVNGFTPRRANLMRAMADGLALIADRRFSYEPLITHRFGLDKVDSAFALFDERPPGFIKSVVMP